LSSYEKDEFQELKLLKNGLSGLRENLHREIGFFLTTLDNATDPIQVLTSDKGKWLLTNPFSDTTEMINHLVRNISFRLYTASRERFLTVSATISKNKELTLGFGPQGGDVLVYWKVFSNTVIVPEWDNIIESKDKRESLIEEMEKKESGYQGNSIKHLLQNTCIHFVPMLNPDGVSLVQNGLNGIGSEELRKSVLEMAQKEHATHLSSYFRLWKNNLRGVNLNKNFDVNWEQTVDKKGYPSKDEYKGSSAESEVESKALADLQRKENFSATISYHTQGEVIYWYFGEGSYVEEAKKLAEIIKKNSNYRMVNSYHENYAGGFKDYMERKFNVPSVTVECGSGTSPVSEEQIDKIWAGQRGVLPDLLLEYKES